VEDEMTVVATTPAGAPAAVSSADDAAGRLIAELATMAMTDPRRPALRERTVEAWLPLARHLARRYGGRGEPFDDLLQVAVVGLIKSVDRYDADRGVEFAAFAIPTVLGEIKRHFRDRTWSIRVPRRLQEIRMRMTAADNALTHQLGRAPTVPEIAEFLGVSDEEIIEGIEGARAYQTASLSTPVGEESGVELGDTLGADDTGYELTELRMALGPALATLGEREQRIVSLRFYGNQTQAQIADQLGISQMHVSRLLTRSIAALRRQMAETD
jgi:RNA polymerase sigma-B factor